jgi:hypothetical protein
MSTNNDKELSTPHTDPETSRNPEPLPSSITPDPIITRLTRASNDQFELRRGTERVLTDAPSSHLALLLLASGTGAETCCGEGKDLLLDFPTFDGFRRFYAIRSGASIGANGETDDWEISLLPFAVADNPLGLAIPKGMPFFDAADVVVTVRWVQRRGSSTCQMARIRVHYLPDGKHAESSPVRSLLHGRSGDRGRFH